MTGTQCSDIWSNILNVPVRVCLDEIFIEISGLWVKQFAVRNASGPHPVWDKLLNRTVWGHEGTHEHEGTHALCKFFSAHALSYYDIPIIMKFILQIRCLWTAPDPCNGLFTRHVFFSLWQVPNEECTKVNLWSWNPDFFQGSLSLQNAPLSIWKTSHHS